MERTLYERLGGAPGIAALVDDVVEAHMNNPAIRERFIPYRQDPQKIAVIKRNTCAFLGMGSGGPEVYEGRSMIDAHTGMSISEEEFTAACSDIMETLARHRIAEDARSEVSGMLASMKDQIVFK